MQMLPSTIIIIRVVTYSLLRDILQMAYITDAKKARLRLYGEHMSTT